MSSTSSTLLPLWQEAQYFLGERRKRSNTKVLGQPFVGFGRDDAMVGEALDDLVAVLPIHYMAMFSTPQQL